MIPFRMDVRDLLELEGAFQGHGMHGAAAQEERVLVLHHGLRDLRDGGVLTKHGFDEFRQPGDLSRQGETAFAG